MRISIRTASLSFLFLAAPALLAAQAPVEAGTATALGLGAMTEARFPVATLWNPALLGIFDGPARSYEVLSGSGASPRPGALINYFSSLDDVATDRSDVVQGSLLSGLSSFYRNGKVRQLDGHAGIELLGLQNQTFGVSLTTNALSSERIPDRALKIMTGDVAAINTPTTPADSILASSTTGHRWVGTTLALSQAYDMGIQPGWGHVWTGVSVTGTLLHSTSLSRAIYTDASTDFVPDISIDPSAPVGPGTVGVDYMSVGIRNTQVYGMSLGVVSNPAAPILLSATLVNPFQLVRGPRKVSDVSWLDTRFAGLDATGHTRAYARRVVVDSTTPAWVQNDANSLIHDAEFSSAIRLGMSVDQKWGRFVTGYNMPVKSRDALDANTGERWTVGFIRPASALHLRGSISGLQDGGRRVLGGLELGFCGSRMSIGGGTERHPGSPVATVISFGWSHGDGACGLLR